jgi:hypothetical protein
MRQNLKLHPDWRSAAVVGIAVDVARLAPGKLALAYVVTGDLARVRLPPMSASARTDNLWRHTCFEAFIAADAEDGYLELNFAPSTEWAAYRFTGYRAGMEAADIPVPEIAVTSASEVRVAVDLAGALPQSARWRLGLSAVLEETDGARSYWALAHPPGKADFHHASSFALTLPPLERA